MSARMVRVAALSLFFFTVVLAGTPGTLKWRYATGGEVGGTPALGSDGTVYAGSGDGCLYAMNPNGTLRWRYATGGGIFSSPTVGADGTVYFGSDDHHVYALKPSGVLKWRYPINGYPWPSPAVGVDGTIFVGSYATGYSLYALNPNGTLKWRYSDYDVLFSSPAVGADGTIYVGSLNGNVYALYPNGSEKWHYETGPGLCVWSSPTVGADGTLFIGSEDGDLCAIRPNGTLRWRCAAGFSIESSPAIGSEGTVYVGGGEDGYLCAVRSTGSLKWRYQTGGCVDCSPALGADGTVYFGSYDNYLYALYSDGTLRWRYKTGNRIRYGSPAIGSDGTVYIGSCDGYIYAVYGSAPLANSPWPKFHHDNRNTGWVGGPQTRVVRVKNDGKPVAGCSVYVNDVAQPKLTDSRGEIRIENLRQGDLVWAKKKVHTEPAVKPGHEAVDNTMYELWMDTKTLQKSGSKWDWLPYKVSGTTGDIDLNLAHPLFKWNLVVCTEWDAPDASDYFAKLTGQLEKASEYLYNVSDGQMMLGKVVLTDSSGKYNQGHFAKADVNNVADGGYRSNSAVAIFDTTDDSWDNWAIRGVTGTLSQERYTGDLLEPWHRIVIHELGHYALGCWDEYIDGNREDIPLWKRFTVFPWDHGMMDDQSMTTELSSSNDYRREYPETPNPDSVTYQYWKTRRACWEWMKREFNGEYDEIKVMMQGSPEWCGLQGPPSGWWPDGPQEDRRGPESSLSLDVQTLAHSSGAFDAKVVCTHQGFPKAGTRASVRVGDERAVRGWRYDLGTTDILGAEKALGLHINDTLFAEWNGPSGEHYSGRTVVDDQRSTYYVYMDELPRHGLRSGDSASPKCILSLEAADSSQQTLALTLVADETLAVAPSVAVLLPQSGDSLAVAMSRVGRNTYRGFVGVDSCSFGYVCVSVADTSGNGDSFDGRFDVNDIPSRAGSELMDPGGSASMIIDDYGWTGGGTSVLLTVYPTPALAPDMLALVSGVYSFSVAPVPPLDHPGRITVNLPDRGGWGCDWQSVVIHRWSGQTGAWLPLASTLNPSEGWVSASTESLGVFAVFAQRSSDTTKPASVGDLGGSVNTERQVVLYWSAPGDDSTAGQASSYDTRFSTDSITDSTWNSCQALRWEPSPSPAGDTDSMVVTLPEPDVPYYFALRASDEAGNVSALSNVVSVIAAAPPPMPMGNLPVNRSYLKDATPEFWWDSTWTDTGFYRLQYARNPQFTQGLVTFDSLDTITVTVPDSMALVEGAWYWRVAAYDTFGNTYGYQEPPYQFTIDTTPPAAPMLCWPADSQYVGSRKPWLIWTASGGDWGSYLVQLSRDSLFADTLGLYPNIYDTAYRLQVPLPESTTLVYWRVQATDGAGNAGGFSARSRFIVDTMIPPTPLQVLPYDGDMVYDSTPSLVWTNVAADTVLKLGLANLATFSRSRPVGPVTYRLQISLNDNFSPCVVETSGITNTTFTIRDGLSLSDSTFFWRVEAIDSSDRHSGFLPKWWFIVEARADIAGNVNYYSNSLAVPGVKLVAEGRTDTTETGQFGDYAVTNLPMFLDYAVAPLKRETARQGAVTAYDAFLVLTHALHRDTLDSVQFTAADVTGDSTISAFDAQRILEYAVARRSHFPVGARPGGDTADWEFRPVSRSYDSIWENQTDQDHEGILYGDPSGNWPGNQLIETWTGTAGTGRATYFDLNMPSSSGGTNVEVQRAQVTVLSGPPRDVQQVARASVQVERPMNECVFPVVAKKARDAVSADILVRYDVGRYILRGIRTTEQTEGFMVAATDRDGLVRISMAGTRKLDGDVTLLELLFDETNPAAKDVASASVANVRAPQKDLPATGSIRSPVAAPNAVTVTPVATGSGIVQPAEVVWLVLNEGRSPQGLAAEDGAMGDKRGLPATFYLAAPRPNPFGDGTCIAYGLPVTSRARLIVYDAAGRMVRLLAEAKLAAGRYTTVWNGRDAKGRSLSNGIYFIRMQTDNQQFQRKVTLVHR